jgi:hypothetical protein
MLSIRSKLLVCSFLVVLIVPVTAHTQAPATPAPGVAIGQKIGTIVKTAVSTASPGISGLLSLLDSIWTSLGKSSSDKVSATDAKAAASTKPAVAAAVKAPAIAAQQAIQPIGKVSDEIGVVARFLGPSVKATQNLIVIQTISSEANPDWTEIGNNWDLAKIQVGNLKSVSDTDLDKIRDAYLRLRLAQIRDSNDTTVVSIGQDVSQKNLPNLKAHLAILVATLADMTAVAGYELAELQADIADLANWAKGSGGGISSPDWSTYRLFLDANVHAH